MHEEYQIFDVVEDEFDEFKLHPNSEHFVYIHKSVYDKQVQCGQETFMKTMQQIGIDTPRSNVKIDGEKVKIFPDFLTLNLTRYCTQTVMGFPVEILSKLGLVAEAKKPHRLKIDVWGENVFVKKKLRILQDSSWVPVQIQINADMNDPCVILKIQSGTLEDGEILYSESTQRV
tara:strand:- start:359 stop:880 length:522 start_codon:yes stop_codon:yes gene_type:complete